MKYLFSFLLFVSLIFLSPLQVNAQIVINEINPSQEWVELYNTSSGEINLDGCTLNMGSSSQTVTFTSSDSISPSSYKVAEKGITFDWGSNWLNDGGDTVTLDCVSVGDDSKSYTGEVGNDSYGRSPNGIGSFVILSSSKGSSNPIPTPTSTSTSSPTAIASPTATSTPTSTPAKTPTPKPSATPTKSPTPKPTEEPSESPQVLGVSAKTQRPSSTPDVLVEGDTKKKLPIIPIVLITSGVLIIGLAILQLIHARKNPQEN